MHRLEDIEGALVRTTPRVLDPAHFEQAASVALVLYPQADDCALLFIQRREHPDDPWSGHSAFPGGRIDPCDRDARAAAERETLEEVGIDLMPARHIGRLDDLTGRSASLVVSAFVYALDSTVPVTPNYEVADTRWMPLREIEAEERQVERDFTYREHTLALPGIRVFDPPALPLWGLSYRFLELFMQAQGRSIPPMPWDESL